MLKRSMVVVEQPKNDISASIAPFMVTPRPMMHVLMMRLSLKSIPRALKTPRTIALFMWSPKARSPEIARSPDMRDPWSTIWPPMRAAFKLSVPWRTRSRAKNESSTVAREQSIPPTILASSKLTQAKRPRRSLHPSLILVSERSSFPDTLLSERLQHPTSCKCRSARSPVIAAPMHRSESAFTWSRTSDPSILTRSRHKSACCKGWRILNVPRTYAASKLTTVIEHSSSVIPCSNRVRETSN
ncbi:MAG: hypothetical protein QOF71_2240 [Candidatus Eremiobacteraeota bacterium]|nr:hypothetical protein [Candidatus Eremiobacteraeota bacterium]